VIFPCWELPVRVQNVTELLTAYPGSIFFTTILYLRGLNRPDSEKQQVEIVQLWNCLFLVPPGHIYSIEGEWQC